MRSVFEALGFSNLAGTEFNTMNKQGPSIAPQSLSGSSAVNGTYFDTKGFSTAMLRANAQAASGAPSAASVAFVLQESAASGSGYAAANDNTGTQIGGTATVTSAAADVLARIEGLGQNRKRYLRIVATPSFTGGTSPATLVFAEIIAARGFNQPTQTATSNT